MSKGLTVQDVAKKLGKHENTIYFWIRSGLLPAVKLGKSYIIKQSELEKLLKGE